MLSGPAWGRTKRRAMRDGMAKDLHEAALAYHRLPKPGKLEISATKPLANQRDLALASSPGVAAASYENVRDHAAAYTLTERATLLPDVTTGTSRECVAALRPPTRSRLQGTQ